MKRSTSKGVAWVMVVVVILSMAAVVFRFVETLFGNSSSTRSFLATVVISIASIVLGGLAVSLSVFLLFGSATLLMKFFGRPSTTFKDDDRLPTKASQDKRFKNAPCEQRPAIADEVEMMSNSAQRMKLPDADGWKVLSEKQNARVAKGEVPV